MNIGIDIDGVLADSVSCWLRELNKYFKQEKSLSDLTSYQFEKIYNVSWADMDKFFRTNQELLLSNLEPIKDAAVVIDGIIKNHRVFLITARPEIYRHKTVRWLEEHKIKFTQMFMTNYGDKSLLCKQLKLDLYIEDSLDNALAIAEKGIPVLLFEAPYNQGELPQLIKRIKSWHQIEQELAGFINL